MATTKPRTTGHDPVVLAVTNHKGGVGKTTSAVNIAVELAHRGHRVLLGDLDMQANATKSLVRGGLPDAATIGNALLGEGSLQSVLLATEVEGLHLAPANRFLSKQGDQLYQVEGYQDRLKKLLAKVRPDYDFVVLDCPPNLGVMTYMAFVAATAYVVPCEPEAFAFEGLQRVVETATNIQQAGINKHLKLAGVFFTKYNPKLRSQLHEDIVLAAEHVYQQLVLPNIRPDQRLAKAQRKAQPTRVLFPDCNGVQDYAALTDSILKNL